MSEAPGELEISYSPGLEDWLGEQGVSLAFAVPPSKLFFIGLRDDGRLSAFERWQTMREPRWAKLKYPEIDYQDAYYYSAPKSKPKLDSLDQVDPKSAPKAAPRDVFAYVIHEGKVRAPAAAMALIERVKA